MMSNVEFEGKSSRALPNNWQAEGCSSCILGSAIHQKRICEAGTQRRSVGLPDCALLQQDGSGGDDHELGHGHYIVPWVCITHDALAGADHRWPWIRTQPLHCFVGVHCSQLAGATCALFREDLKNDGVHYRHIKH